jgi:DHA2 family multidrug resistance protein-like MFS transporter
MTLAAPSTPHDGLENPQRAFVFLTMAVVITMAVLDGAIVNIALPTISRDLAISPANAVWIVNSYQLAVTIALLPLAALGDSIGYRRVYWCGLLLFTASSLVCALSTGLVTLTLARMTQGLGAAGLMSVNIAYVRFIYPRSRLGQGVGNMAVVVASSSAAGPSIAAAILGVASWRWLFFVNVPIGVVALVLAARMMPATPQSNHRIDALSVVLNALTFGLLIFGVDSIGASGGLEPALVELAGAAVFAALLVWRQLGEKAPLLPIDLLRRPIFALSMATSISSFAAQSLSYVALPFYFEDSLGRSATATGLLMTPWPLAVALIAPIAGRLADRFNPGLLGSAGLLVLALGLGLVAALPAEPASLDIAWRLAVCGLGFGFFQSPNNRLIIGSAPRERSGGASGLQSTGRLVGQSLGAALMAALFGRFPAHATTIAIVAACGLALAASIASGLRRSE